MTMGNKNTSIAELEKKIGISFIFDLAPCTQWMP